MFKQLSQFRTQRDKWHMKWKFVNCGNNCVFCPRFLKKIIMKMFHCPDLSLLKSRCISFFSLSEWDINHSPWHFAWSAMQSANFYRCPSWLQKGEARRQQKMPGFFSRLRRFCSPQKKPVCCDKCHCAESAWWTV